VGGEVPTVHLPLIVKLEPEPEHAGLMNRGSDLNAGGDAGFFGWGDVYESFHHVAPQRRVRFIVHGNMTYLSACADAKLIRTSFLASWNAFSYVSP
jgi:hypothetical protein